MAEPHPLPPEAGPELVRRAREAVQIYAQERRRAEPRESAPWLAWRRGLFVTLRRGGALRGCIGTVVADKSLANNVVTYAVLAAFEDPRFSPVAIDELGDLQVEVSVLTPPVPCAADEIEVGRHGVIASSGARRGLLLPQVARERHWDRETLLRQTCLKAGLPEDAWTRGAQLERFEAEVF